MRITPSATATGRPCAGSKLRSNSSVIATRCKLRPGLCKTGCRLTRKLNIREPMPAPPAFNEHRGKIWHCKSPSIRSSRSPCRKAARRAWPSRSGLVVGGSISAVAVGQGQGGAWAGRPVAADARRAPDRGNLRHATRRLDAALYMAEGAMGLPVFQGTPEKGIGIAYMVGSTGGYLAGFLVMAAIVGWAVDQVLGPQPVKLLAAMLVAEMVMMAMGFSWLAVLIGAEKAWQFGVVPFIVPDLIKVALASALVPAVWALLPKHR